MKTIDMTKLDGDGFTLHFGGEAQKISAVAFGKALIYLVQAAKHIGDDVHPEADIEISIDSVKSGSLIVDLAVSFAGGFGGAIGAALFYNIWKIHARSKLESKDSDEGNVISIRSGDTEVKMKKEALEIASRADSIPEINDLITKSLRIMMKEPPMESVGIGDSRQKKPELDLSSSMFPTIVKNADEIKKKKTDHEEIITNLLVRIPVLERSPRRWEFILDGRKIMASITDEDFFDRLESGKVAIKKGDEFRVSLRIYGKGKRKRYEVIKFL